MPAEAAPTLGEHEQVEGGAVLLVVGFEEISGIGDKAAQLRGEEHLGEDVGGVEGVVARAYVAHRERDGRGRRRGRGASGGCYVEGDVLEGLIVGLQARHFERRRQGCCGHDEEEAVSPNAAVGIEDRDLMHTCRQRCLSLGERIRRELQAGRLRCRCYGLALNDNAFAHDGQAKFLGGSCALRADIKEIFVALAADRERHAVGRHAFGGLAGAAAIGGSERSFVARARCGRQGEQSATAGARGRFGDDVALSIAECYAPLKGLTRLGSSLKG